MIAFWRKSTCLQNYESFLDTVVVVFGIGSSI